MPHPHEGEHLSSLRSTDPLPDWVSARRRAIGDRIRAARTHRNLTQEGLAELAGLDRKTVNRVEEGAHSPLLDHLLLIADALGVPLADLVREE
ncbi:helix-turn-helix domain-containing protein [Streptomyces sp. NBC_01591]|uniref:helix-turn-helix domain-containing protein n=1 Tax=Streptomyces sp. NBC_01591 TaxID=2975888 RepID=UPI002DDBC14F|nr:helix-turn-helix transcriptional regulator [Streptomyces sp. NBC_01591]WSD68287.1 helix-turn-helix domain-containing protein [Streptomyces sp. NBC_01591]